MRTSFIRLMAVFGAVLTISTVTLRSEPWRDIDPSEFENDAPLVDPEYGAEVLFKEVTVKQVFIDNYTTRSFHSSRRVYTRLRVYDDESAQQVVKQQIRYKGGQRVEKIMARVVKPTGEISELDSKTVFKTEDIKWNGKDYKAVRFGLPKLEPLDIVEIQYRIEHNAGNVLTSSFMDFGTAWPARKVVFKYSPAEVDNWGVNFRFFGFPKRDKPIKPKGDVYTFEMVSLPAVLDEPFSMPRAHLAPNILVYYSKNKGVVTKDRFWQGEARKLHNESKVDFKPTNAIQAKAIEITKGLKTEEEKLRALYDFCRVEIKNRDRIFRYFTDEELRTMGEANTAAKALKIGNGWITEITRLFGALAKSIGTDVYWAACPDRSEMMFNTNLTFEWALDKMYVAFKLNDQWVYCRPGNPYLPFGEAEWYNTGGKVMIGTKKFEGFEVIEKQPSSFSKNIEKGQFYIDEEGELSGSVTIAREGHLSTRAKWKLARLINSDELEERIRESFFRQYESAEISDLVIEGLENPLDDLSIKFSVSIPDYATIVGDRLFIKPAVFQNGKKRLFENEKRGGDILMPFAREDVSKVKIMLPDGFELEEGAAPAPIDIAPLGEYSMKLGISAKDGGIICKRKFAVEVTYLPAKYYQNLRNVYAQVSRSDDQTLTFRRIQNSAEEVAGSE